MNRHTLKFALLVVILIPVLAYGQEEQLKLPEPPYSGRIVFINGDSSIPLEQQKASAKAKAD